MSDSAAKLRPKGKVLRGDEGLRAATAPTLSNILDGKPDARKSPRSSGGIEAQRLEAQRQGYADGLMRATQEVEMAMADATKKVNRALAALSAAVDSFDQRQAVALKEVEDEITMTALAIASALLQREINAATDPGADAIARALALAPNNGLVIARLHPEDAQTLNMEHVNTGGRTVQVVPDPTVEPGGCIVDAGDLRIDAQVSSALQGVKNALKLADASIEFTDPQPMKTKSESVAGSDAPTSGKTVLEAPSA